MERFKNCLLSKVVQDRVVQINPNHSWTFLRGRILGSFLIPIFYMLAATGRLALVVKKKN